MSQELLKLKVQNKTDTKRGAKKRFFLANIELIFDLIDNYGISYLQIIEAAKKEGVYFSYDYFRELMANENKDRKKQKRVNNGKLPAKPVESKSHRAGLGAVPEPKKANEGGLSPEKQAVKDELDRIRDDNSLTLAQKREAAAKATASLVNKNPLANRK